MRESSDFRNYYEKISDIETGLSSIYKAKLKNTNEMRVVKVFKKQMIKNLLKNVLLREPKEEELKSYIDCFFTEINNMKISEGDNNNNINTVKFYEYFNTKEEFAIVMELCDENMISFLAKKKKGISLDEIRKIMKDLNNTFKIINEKKIIFRHLKLENILIKYMDKEKTHYIVKLKLINNSDLILKLNRLNSSLTREHNSNCLNAPEILKKEAYEEKCDLWSLGILMYVLYFKNYPYKGAAEEAILDKIKRFGQNSLKKTENSEFDNLIKQLLIEDPLKRITWKEYFMHPFFNFYEKINRIAISGYATIYKAKSKKTGELRAIKIFDKKKIKDGFIEEFLRQPTEKDLKPYYDSFYNEVKTMQIIEGKNKENKNTVKFYEYHDNKEEFTIVMELCDDNLLNVLIERKEVFKPEEIFYILNQLNNSFEIMVNNKLVHRALKLENILIKYENKEKTKYITKLKFTNESCYLEDLSKGNSLNIVISNMKILAPEILSQDNYNEKCDLWSLGIIIYVLSFKEYPYNGDTGIEILNKIKNSGQSELKKTKNKKLDYLISKLLIEEPNKRISWNQYFSLFKEQDYKKYYKLINRIGQGGFGIVYEAINIKTNEKRAIKIFDKQRIREGLRGSAINNEINLNDYMKDLFNEIENMKIVEGKNNENENTVKFYEYFDNENEFAIVMELCDESLTNFIIERKKPFSIEEIFDFLIQLNNSFKIMDENKLAHRDLKLENILVKCNSKGKIIYKIADYGTSKQLINLSRSHTTAGTLYFMAPEIIEFGNYNEKCDLWSLGIILYVLCFQKYPYKGENDFALINNINNLGQKHFEKKKHYYLDELISKLLVKDPEKRLNWKEYFNHPFITNKKYLNQITIKLLVDCKDLKKEKGIEFQNIYFLENELEKNANNKELNNEICTLYINNEQKEFKKYFKPSKEGIYEIRIIFKNPIKDCSYMFNKCKNIINLDLSSFDSSNVSNMSYMFNECSNLEEINLNNVKVNNVKDMSNMFSKCFELKKIIFPESFETKNLENMASMFYWCENLTEINFSQAFITDKVSNMKLLFGKCFNLKKLILIFFNTEEVINMNSMFSECKNLEEIVINPLIFKTDKVINMGYMFNDCQSLKEFNLSSFNINNVKYANYMFKNCKKLDEVDLSKSEMNFEANICHMFEGCNSINVINIPCLNIVDNKKIEDMFKNISTGCYININSECTNEYIKRFPFIENQINN